MRESNDPTIKKSLSNIVVQQSAQFVHLSLYLRGVKAKIRLTLNSIVDLCTTRLISGYNEIDQRFHKLSIFMQAWR